MEALAQKELNFDNEIIPGEIAQRKTDPLKFKDDEFLKPQT